MTNDVELSDEQRRSLAGLKRDMAAPPEVEQRIVAALRDRGLIQAPKSILRWFAVAASLAIAFGAGVWVQRQSVVGTRTEMPRFVLLLYGGAAGEGASRRAEYASWARGVANRGIAIDGEELGGDEIALPEWSATNAARSPRGFFVLSAPTIEDAKQVAATCPHLLHGGGIVIRAIVGPGSPRS